MSAPRETPAEVLRRAADLMEARACAATQGRWEAGGPYPGVPVHVRSRWIDHQGRRCTCFPVLEVGADEIAERDAAHIAAADPAFMVATAALFRNLADGLPSGFSQYWTAAESLALRAARTYLREHDTTTDAALGVAGDEEKRHG